MGTFRNVGKFNEALQDEIETLRLNVEAKNYEALKEDPKKYNFSESDDYMTFILKNREEDNKTLKNFRIFRVFEEREKIALRSFNIFKSEMDFLKEAAEKEYRDKKEAKICS